MSSQHYTPSSQLGMGLPETIIPTSRSHQQIQQSYPSEDVVHSLNVGTLMRIRRAVDLIAHVVIAILSVYAFGSIISAMQLPYYVSPSAVFLFLVTGISFAMAVTYSGLAWWTRSPRGIEQIRGYFQQRDMNEVTVTKQSPSSPSWMTRISVFLISDRPRFWIQAVLIVLCLLTATSQALKVKGKTNCNRVQPRFHHFCSSTNAAIVSTFLTGFIWMAWWGWLLYKSRSTSDGIDNEVSEEAQTQDVLISMPHERAFPETTEISGGVSRGSVGPSVALSESNSDDNMEKSQPKNKEYVPPPFEKSPQHTAMVPMNPQNSPFGLGIDIYTKNATAMVASNSENEDARINNSSPGTVIPNSANHSKATLEDINRTQGSLNKLHRDNTSLSGINAAALSRTPARSRSNSTTSNQSTSNITGRLRDYAKVFPMPRSTASSIHEAYSDRGTPVMHSASREFAPGSAQPFRGGMGYMGAHTMKALNNFPRSVSMGNVAAQNNATAGSSITPDRASPVVSNMPPGGLESSQTPVKSKSQSMSNIFGIGPSEGYYPQTPAEAEASEQSMDEHLRAIRRRSAAAEAMNIQCNNNENPIFAADMVASPAPSSRASSFRMSFSSPNLSPYRRRSSLGLKSALNSIVPLSAKSGSSSGSSSVSSSEASSPCLPSPRESISNNSVGGRSSLEAYSKQQQTVSANELLHAEYGDMYSGRPGAEQTFGDHDQASIVGRGTLRPRSNSVSSNSTTKTVSSGVSDSASSITSNLTSLSTEERRAARAAGPPQAFFNRIKVGHHRKGSQQYHKKQHHHIQGRGPNSSKKEIAAMIPAHSSQSENGSSSQLSRDNRSDMPIN